MNILIEILSFIIGWILGVITRDILMKILKIRNKIKRAEEIIAEDEKRKKFKEKYDFSDSFEEDEK